MPAGGECRIQHGLLLTRGAAVLVCAMLVCAVLLALVLWACRHQSCQAMRLMEHPRTGTHTHCARATGEGVYEGEQKQRSRQ